VALGFDHVALARARASPTIIDMKNNLAARHPQGVRLPDGPAAHRRLQADSSLANLQVRLPAVVIGGGLTAIDTATELARLLRGAGREDLERYRDARAEKGEAAVRALDTTTRSGASSRAARARRAIAPSAPSPRPRGASRRSPAAARLVGRRLARVPQALIDSPAYRLNHEEVEKSLEEGVRYIENLAPVEADPRRATAR
jgi:hypothetical protein